MGSRVIVGVFAWILAFSFGAAAIDSIYAHAIVATGEAQALAGLFNEISDLLQLPLVLTVLAGLGSLALSSRQPRARALVIAALCLVLVPFVLVLLPGSQIDAAGLGTWLRLGSAALASVCAMLAALVFIPS